ncbi:MAG TPA: aminotransferase class I/II-fold pyridoxal phosphate-dependent enzyme [Woeseiaceae bacterium]|jgi:glutamate/tyrosine decarboxylase-like PLP-dependent enzyme|nr:aminotransferase class I/II-fold pyridoxal phosphate-dependent enzyme [Woeseiaceae bacterium]
MPLVDPRELDILDKALDTLSGGFEDLPDGGGDFDADAIGAVLQEVALRMRDNYPYHHARYAGQMLKPPHPVARLAYALSLWLNPNNHALDGGRASSALERESVATLASMLGLKEHLGHLCGGGTMANLEALWAAGRLAPGRILASTQAHYTHERVSEVLRLEFATVPVDAHGRMDLQALETVLAGGGAGTVVATLGTTGLGAVDPLAGILELRARYGFRVHVDAAYGGFFRLASALGDEPARHFARIADADSIVIDPHKHGLQPYGCGCVLFRDPSVGALYRHDSPYTYFSSAELHLGEISLECSRPGAAAVALWATQKLLPFVPGGPFAARLDASLQAARALWRRVADSERFFALMEPELDIVVFGLAAPDAETASRRAREAFEQAAARQLHLALIDLPAEIVANYLPSMTRNRPAVTCLRSCLMKPEHLDAVDEMIAILDAV